MRYAIELIFVVSFVLIMLPCALSPLFESEEKKIKRIIAKYDIFFALDSVEYNKLAKPNIEYIRDICGLLCPKANYAAFNKELHKMNKTDNLSEYIRLFTLAQE